MNETTLYGPPPATLGILLDDPGEHDFPVVERIVGDLTPDQAVCVPPGLPYSVARIVAHMTSNMKFNLGLIRAPDPLSYADRFEDWPEITAAQWPGLVVEFLATLAALVRVARAEKDLGRIVYGATPTAPAWTVGYKLACSVAKHNAYHLGQIVVLRRLIGTWSDPRGGA